MFIQATARELNKKYGEEWIITALALGRVEGTPMDKGTINDMVKLMNISQRVSQCAVKQEYSTWTWHFTCGGCRMGGAFWPNMVSLPAEMCSGSTVDNFRDDKDGKSDVSGVDGRIPCR